MTNKSYTISKMQLILLRVLAAIFIVKSTGELFLQGAKQLLYQKL